MCCGRRENPKGSWISTDTLETGLYIEDWWSHSWCLLGTSFSWAVIVPYWRGANSEAVIDLCSWSTYKCTFKSWLHTFTIKFNASQDCGKLHVKTCFTVFIETWRKEGSFGTVPFALYLLFRQSQHSDWDRGGGHNLLRICLGTFMINRPTLSSGYWWEFVYTEWCVASQLTCLSVTSFLNVMLRIFMCVVLLTKSKTPFDF